MTVEVHRSFLFEKKVKKWNSVAYVPKNISYILFLANYRDAL